MTTICQSPICRTHDRCHYRLLTLNGKEFDATDTQLAAAKRLEVAQGSGQSAFPPFPALSDEEIEDGFCGLGNGFALDGDRPLARGEVVLALGGPRLEMLTADMRGMVVRVEVFRWGMYRQEHIYGLLEHAVALFLASPVERHLHQAASAQAPSSLEIADPEAEAALQQALASGDLSLLRGSIELHSERASSQTVQAARAERDRLAKKAKKERSKGRKTGDGHTMGCAVVLNDNFER